MTWVGIGVLIVIFFAIAEWLFTKFIPAAWEVAKELVTIVIAIFRGLGTFGRYLFVSWKAPVITKPASLSLRYPRDQLAEISRRTVATIKSSAQLDEFQVSVGPYPPALDLERPSNRPKSLYANESVPHVTQEILKSLLICEEVDRLMAGALTFQMPAIRVKTPPRPTQPNIEGEYLDTSETEKKLNELLSEEPTISPAESQLTDLKGRWYREKYAEQYRIFAGEVAERKNLIDGFTKLLEAQKTTTKGWKMRVKMRPIASLRPVKITTRPFPSRLDASRPREKKPSHLFAS